MTFCHAVSDPTKYPLPDEWSPRTGYDGLRLGLSAFLEPTFLSRDSVPFYFAVDVQRFYAGISIVGMCMCFPCFANLPLHAGGAPSDRGPLAGESTVNPTSGIADLKEMNIDHVFLCGQNFLIYFRVQSSVLFGVAGN